MPKHGQCQCKEPTTMTTGTTQINAGKHAFAYDLGQWRKSLPGNQTQEQAARVLGVPLKTYRAWEQGRHMPSGYVLNIVRKHISKP